MKRKSSTPTMKDVAREAGVALGTVSKVFNNIPVGESYRLRVEQAAEKLGYQVNSYARSLKVDRSNTVALIIPDTINPYFSLLTNYIAGGLAARGYRMLLATTASDPDTESKYIQMAKQDKVAGIIALTYKPTLTVTEPLPFVSIDRYYSTAIPCVASDYFGGGELAARKLEALGCRSLLFLRIGSSVQGETDKRGLGFEAYCRQHKLRYETFLANDEDGVEVIFDFLRSHMDGKVPDFDGIFCNTDKLAFITHNYLEQRGIQVPEEVQIIGYDGLNFFGDVTMPCCSSIVQPVEEIAKTAISILLSEDRASSPSLTCLPAGYRPGGTTREDIN